MTGSADPDPSEAIAAFENGAIDSQRFDHAAHVRIAWCYLRRHPPLPAISRFLEALERLTERLGARDKYHATVSVFFMLLIAERMAAAPAADWAAFRAANADLIRGAATLLRAHYSEARLQSALARSQFLLPDRAALPAGSQGAATTL